MQATDTERLARLEAEMRVALEGVQNFRTFQSKMSSFVDAHEARENERDTLNRKRARIHYSLLSALIALVVGCAIALFTWVLNGHHVVSENTQVVTHSGPADASAGQTHF